MVKLRSILTLLCVGACAASGYPVRQSSLKVRLLNALTSYDSQNGSEFRSVVIAPYMRHHRVILPPGTIVLGTVHKARQIGIGMVHERATIELVFHDYVLPDGRQFPFRGTLRRIDNSRETVNDEGKIEGILAANNPQSLIQGIWHRPRLGLFPRSFIGMTGAGGRIVSAYSMGPIGAGVLFAARIAMFRLPEPEVQLPIGTEMGLAVSQLPEDAPDFDVAPPEVLAPELERWLSSRPVEVTKPGGVRAADIINMAFVGSRESLAQAFRAAGWFEAEPLTARTFSRTYKSFTRQTGYPGAPVSKLLYEGAEPEATFQKSFNTISKRHHIRVWRAQEATEAQPEIWLGAATHDVGVEFISAAMTFTHKINPHIDAEREKVVNDLLFAGCSASPAYVERPSAARKGGIARQIVTDGRLATLVLTKECADASLPAHPTMQSSPKSTLARMARRMMLEGRQYAIRGNAYYWAYRALTLHRSPKEQERALNE